MISAPQNEMLVLLLPSNEAKANTSGDPQSCMDVNSLALERAQDIQANTSPHYPSFFKQLRKSHLSGKFYLGLPKKFCDAHLPIHNDSVILVDENEQEFSTKYSVQKNRLSGGWRGFSIAHNLLEGDALVFHLIEPCKFKVYIVRASNFNENDGASGCQTFGFQNNKPNDTAEKTEENAHIGENQTQKYPNSPAVDTHQVKKKARLVSESKPTTESSNDSDYFGGIRYSESLIYFKDIRGLENFRIQVNGIILDSEIPTHIRSKYYELCCSQKKFLHDHLIKSLSKNLTIAIISETIDIANAIRTANLNTSLHQLECWEKTLKAFEDLGMEVGFLRARLHNLTIISSESQTIVESKIKRALAKEGIRNLETTTLNAKALIGSLDAEDEVLNLRNEKLNFDFQHLAGAPW
ncbi:hypothetical protein ACJIZ3_015486 [Penstemon smallii]|uniref:TF-B3 domain-containing protein n=1 Tax=Penstemon smallii TaxID=265156 RepID=A0ABD3RMR2_9LAMI